MELLWLGHPECHDAALVGGKAASLNGLAAEYRVPLGFCVTTVALDGWSEGDGVDVPRDDVREALAYQTLGDRCGAANLRVAVRSLAADEDDGSASFAGQYETYLNVSGVDAVVEPKDGVARPT